MLRQSGQMLKMSKFFIKIFFLLCLSAVSLAAQETALPVVAESKPIADLKPLLAAAKENKQPLLINFWATWCGPCRVEFPELVRIDADYRPKGLDFAIVSLDNPGANEMIVSGFLRSYGSTMPSYLIDLPTRAEIERAVRRVAPRSRGGLPLTLLFNAKGKLVYQKAGVVDAKILRSKIDKALAEKPVPKM